MFASVILPSQSQAQLPVHINSSGAIFEIGAASATVDEFSRSWLSSLASSLWASSGRASLLGTGSVARFASGHTTAYAELHGALALSSNARNISAFRLDGGGGSYRGHTSSRYFETSVVLGRAAAGGRRAAWIQAGTGRAGDATTDITVRGGIGASMRSTSAAIDGTLTMANVSHLRYSDAIAHAQWAPFQRGPIEVARFVAGADAGFRLGDNLPGRAAWVSGGATFRVVGPVSVAAFAGAQPADPMRGTPGVTFTSLALRFVLSRPHAEAPATIAPRATSVSANQTGGRRVITVLLPHAKRVELMADFTGWLPVEMTRAGPGIWQARAAIGQGSHRLNIRTDGGAWQPAPGIPIADDDFGGEVGILVVP